MHQTNKVLLLSQCIRTGGLEYQMLNHAETLQKLGVWSPIVLAYENSDTQELLLAEYNKFKIPVMIKPKSKGFSFSTVFFILYFCLKNKIRVIHSNDLGPFVYGALVRILSLGWIRLVHTQHSFVHLSKHSRYKLFENLCSRVANVVCVVSEHMVRDYLNLGVSKNKIRVVSNGVKFLSTYPSNKSERDSFRNQLLTSIANLNNEKLSQALANKNWLLCMGRISKQKGQPFVIEMWNSLPNDLKKDWCLCIVGPDEKNYFLEVDKNKLFNDGVYLVGTTVEASLWYASSQLFISASEFEGAPLAPIEAMAMNLPILLSNIEAHKKINDEDQLFPLDDIKKASSMLIECMKGETFYATVTQSNIQLNAQVIARSNKVEDVRSQYGLVAMSKAYQDLYSN